MQPTWTVLVVAFLGVAGTLGAAVFTQFFSARREDRRWRQEQLADEQRWQRQQQERRDLWQREDQLRAVQQREDAYTQFLLAVAKWASATETVVMDPAGVPHPPGEEELARLSALAEQAEAACVPLRLHGSEAMATASDEVCRVIMSIVRRLPETPLRKEQVDQALLDFRRTSDLALARARADLGVS
jgi:hypothetical protein